MCCYSCSYAIPIYLVPIVDLFLTTAIASVIQCPAKDAESGTNTGADGEFGDCEL